jgi:hypothetical protein
MSRVYNAARMSGPVQTVIFDPLPELPVIRVNPFTGVNPVAGQEFTQVTASGYKLRVREGFIGLRRITVKPKDGKAFGVWVASYAGQEMPLLTNKGQALGFSDAKDKLFALLIADGPCSRPSRVTPADRKVKTPKAPGIQREFDVCQVTLEPSRVCEHCH